jgi:hypothetical protein
VHYERRDSNNQAFDPGIVSPFPGGSRISSEFEDQDEVRDYRPHTGVDHVPIK